MFVPTDAPRTGRPTPVAGTPDLLYRLWHRHYDPTVGRFASLDPYPGNLSNPQSLHRYLYGDADPVNKLDPSGMMSLAGVAVSVRSGLGNFAVKANAVFQAYRRVSSVLDFIETVSSILQIATGGLQPVINEIRKLAAHRLFGSHKSVFSEDGIERAGAALLDNIQRIADEVVTHPDKLKAIGRAFHGQNPAFVILLPTPPVKNVFTVLPPIPTGLKLGSLRIPVFLGFGRENDAGRFVGFGVFDDYKRDKRFDTNAEVLFHMDYIVHASNRPAAEQRQGNIAVWPSADGRFEFQVPRPSA